VNNISNSLLSVLLLPLLLRTADKPLPSSESNFKPHLAVVASEMHHHISGKLPGYKEDASEVGKHFTEKERFRSFERYPESKGEFGSFIRFFSTFVQGRASTLISGLTTCIEIESGCSTRTAINVLNVQTLAKLAGDKVIVNSINPGFCHSELTRNSTGIIVYVIA
jgi:hypothetical protein